MENTCALAICVTNYCAQIVWKVVKHVGKLAARAKKFKYNTLRTYKYMDLNLELSMTYQMSEETRKEIRNGANVVLRDHGHFYRANYSRPSARCWTEHTSLDPVYDIIGTRGTILVGMTLDGCTWVQWERSVCCSMSHFWDWCRYRAFGMNQGPFGESARTESNPIELTPSINVSLLLL